MKIPHLRFLVGRAGVSSLVVALVTAAGAAVLAAVSPAQATSNFATSAIADEAETHADLTSGGQCKFFAGSVVEAVSGSYPSGYQQGFFDAGAVEVTDPANAVRGDIIQVTPAGSDDDTAVSMYDSSSSSAKLHTAIIRAPRNADGTFNVIDSNWSSNNDELVRRHAFNPYTWADGSIIKIWRFGTPQNSGPLSVTQSVALSPSSPRIYQPLTFTYTVRANPIGAVSVKRFVVAVRAPDGSNQDVPCANGNGVSLQPSQSWTCTGSLPQGYGSQGSFEVWADWQDYDDQWHTGQLGGQGNFAVGPPYTLTAVQPASVGPANQITMYTPVNYSYRVKNTSGAAASIQRLIVAVRTAGGGNLDSTCANGTGITMQPNEEWTCAVTLTQGYGSADTLTFWGDWQDYTGTWHTGQLGSATNTLIVTQAPTLTATGALSVGPTSSLAMYQPAYWSYRVKNTSGSWASIQRLIVAVRTPGGGNMDITCDNGHNLTLAPGEEWTCAARNGSGYGSQGTFPFWADWQGYDNAWHTGALSGTLTMNVGAPQTLTTAQGIDISPGNVAPKLTLLHWSYTVRNTTNVPVSVLQFLVAVIGPAGDALNVGCANGSGVSLQPNQTWTCQADLPTGYGSTGQFRYRADWQDYSLIWHTGMLGPQYILTLY